MKGMNVMNEMHKNFLNELLCNEDNLSEYVNSLCESNKFSEKDLAHIFGVLKSEGLVECSFADNRVWALKITFKGKHYFDNEGADYENVPRLIQLIDKLDEIEKLFHVVGGKGFPEFEEIHDVQEFQNWFQELKLELQDILERTHDQFVWETVNVCEKKMNGTTDRKIFSELAGKLRAIQRNITKYYPETENSYMELHGGNMDKEKKTLIFISHSSKNKEQVKMLVDLLTALKLIPKEDIFCSSLPGYDIPIDTEDRIFDFLRDRFLKYNIHVLFVHSPEYYESPVSLNEMGAAWALKSNSTSFLLPGFEFNEMKGVINGDRIAIKLDNDVREVKDKLNQLRRVLEKEFSLSPIDDIIWEDARDKFIEDINHPKEQKRQSQKISSEALFLLKKAADIEDGTILIPWDISHGTSIQIGTEVIVSELPNRREFTKWDAAFKECLQVGYIEQKNKELYVITAAGYKCVDEG